MAGHPAGLFDFTKDLDASPLGLAGVNQTVRKQFDVQRQLGQRNLLEAATSAAGRRGLQRTDTPVFEPFLRGSAELESRLGGQEAQTVLGIGERARDFKESSLATRQGLFQNNQQFFNAQALDTQKFRERLRQQAFENKRSLATLGAEIGLGLGNLRVKAAGTGISLGDLDGLSDSIVSGISLIGEGLDNFF